MESIHEVKEALVARSETTSLDDLRSRGRSRVKVVRAEHIAEMIAEAVQRAVGDSGLISSDEAQSLVEQSRSEFKAVLAEREAELTAARTAEAQLKQAREQLQEAQRRVAELEQELAALQAEPGAAAAMAAGGGMGAELMMRLMNEVAELKAGRGGGGGGGGDASAGLTAVLDKLATDMNARLEQLGKKMGISSAVEAGQVNLDGLFKDMGADNMESNLDNMEVKQKTGSGIAGNLAKLKKLKGGE